MSSTSNRSMKRNEPKRRSEAIKKLKPSSETRVPDEILVTILSKLPIKSLLRFRCVCKSWESLISDKKFNISSPKQKVIAVCKQHPTGCSIHLINDEASSMEVPKPEPLMVRGKKLTIRGSCNGLVLLSDSVDLFLWNPSTRCCKKVFSHARLERLDQSASGLLYDLSTDDYKVVMAFVDRSSRVRDDDKVMVGSFRNKTWTEVCLPYDMRLVKSGPTVNERVHWLVTNSPYNTGYGDMIFLVVGFDPRANEFVEVPMPQSMKEKRVFGFGVLDGCLSLASSTDRGRLNFIEVEIFVMKKYGDQASWTSLFVVSNVGNLCGWRIWVPLCFTKNTEVLMQLETPLAQRICVYNRESNVCRDIRIETKNCTYDVEAATFVESLVSPPYYNWEEEQEYTENFLSKKWKREQGDVAFKVIDS